MCLPHLSLLGVAHRCAIFCMPSGFDLHIASNLFGFSKMVLPFYLAFLWAGDGEDISWHDGKPS